MYQCIVKLRTCVILHKSKNLSKKVNLCKCCRVIPLLVMLFIKTYNYLKFGKRINKPK